MVGKQSQVFIVLIVVVITVSFIVAMVAFRPEPALDVRDDRTEKIEGITAVKEDVVPKVNTQAVVESRVKIPLKSQVSGKIVYTSPRFLTGGAFQTNEIILEVDPSDYQLRLIQAEVDVARAEQELRIEKELSDLAFKDWGKYSKSVATDLVLRLPQLREAEASLKGAKANYDIQYLQLSRTKIVAPFPLMIDSKLVDRGQVVSINQDLVVVFGTDEAEVRMPLSQHQIDLLSISNVGILGKDDVLNVNIRDLSREGDTFWKAKIHRVEGGLDRKSRVYYAVATIIDPMNLHQVAAKPPLLSGAFVDLEVFGQKIENVFRVPTKSMRDDRHIYIYQNGSLITKRVVVAEYGDQYVTIISGIEEGEIICISPPWSYVSGMKATLVNLDGIPFDETLSEKNDTRNAESVGNNLVTSAKVKTSSFGKNILAKTTETSEADKRALPRTSTPKIRSVVQ
ncbi:MAG: RND family efflux transporter MFP subunit [Oceanicoccus sp.]|jgi:RND family efflux transporter MFP subunit